MPDNDSHEKNRLSWNAATAQHNSHKGDRAAFLRNGGSTLFPEEVALLGDVRGKSLVHLQCNAGIDTLSIAHHLGATVTGVDISDVAIESARTLSEQSGIPGTFVRADLYDWFAQNTTQYDVVFVTYGALSWLSDIDGWGRGVAAALQPGGRLVLVEFHPLLNLFDEQTMALTYDYAGGTRYEFDDGVGDYVAESGGGLTLDGSDASTATAFINPHPSVEFAWGIGDVIGAVLGAGLLLTAFQEYPYANGWKPFPQMVDSGNRRMTLPPGEPNMPFMFGLTAQKPT